MAHALLALALIGYLFTSVQVHRTPQDEDDLGKLVEGAGLQHPDLRDVLTILNPSRHPL